MSDPAVHIEEEDMSGESKTPHADHPTNPPESPPSAERVEMKTVSTQLPDPLFHHQQRILQPAAPVGSGGSPPRSPKLTLHRRNRSAGNASKPNRARFAGRETLEHVASKPWDRDFMTIDFLLDAHQHRLENKELKSANQNNGFVGKLRILYFDMQGWLVLGAVGFATALTTAFIQATSDWLIGFRSGVCSLGFFIEKNTCCVVSAGGGGECPYWQSWTEIFFGSQHLLGDSAIFVAISVFLAFLSATFTKVYSQKAAGGGIPEVKSVLGGFIMRQVLGAWVLFIKTIGIILTESSGMSLGSRGPLIHISCCWGNIFSRRFSKYEFNEGKRREVLSASASAGVSAGFGSPLGGVLFSSEALSTYFTKHAMWRSYFCAIVAALVLKAFYSSPLGKIVPFQISYTHAYLWFEVIPFVFLGLIGGVLGAIFIRINLYVQSMRKQVWPKWPVTEAVVLAAVTAFLSFVSIFMRVTTVTLVASLFDICENLDPATEVNSVLCDPNQSAVALMLLFVGLIRFALIIFTFGAKLPGGLWMPLIGVGACIGRAVGIFMKLMEVNYPDSFVFQTCIRSSSECIYPGVYAIVGASAMLGGSTRLTVCLAVTMFEVTGSLIYIIPIMISTVISKVVGDFFGNHGIYDIMVSWKRYPYIPPTADADPSVTATTVMSGEPVCIGAFSETLESLNRILIRYSFSGFPVVLSLQNTSKVVGYISRADLQTAVDLSLGKGMHPTISVVLYNQDHPFNLPENFVDISSYVDRFPIVVSPDTPLDLLLDIFKGLGLRCAIVVKDEVVIGIVKKKDLAEFISTSVMASYMMPFMDVSGQSISVRSGRNSLINSESEPLLEKGLLEE
eukprot:TRINITY_DN19000_c0_g1_i1.p1 TRINITY_DN19000_c0_g1~~TRINITY_DN19000_c0_g1_i1.p1  ORF type:complete len:847 (-),score=154.28 TRINITY_DN19000_c0_g1_i1:20-2560(-)